MVLGQNDFFLYPNIGIWFTAKWYFLIFLINAIFISWLYVSLLQSSFIWIICLGSSSSTFPLDRVFQYCAVQLLFIISQNLFFYHIRGAISVLKIPVLKLKLFTNLGTKIGPEPFIIYFRIETDVLTLRNFLVLNLCGFYLLIS